MGKTSTRYMLMDNCLCGNLVGARILHLPLYTLPILVVFFSKFPRQKGELVVKGKNITEESKRKGKKKEKRTNTGINPAEKNAVAVMGAIQWTSYSAVQPYQKSAIATSGFEMNMGGMRYSGFWMPEFFFVR